MKKLYIFLLISFLPAMAKAQCFAQVTWTNATCFGNCDGTATCYPVGTGPYTYLWAPGGQTTQTISGLCAGSYTCTMTDANNCTASASCTVGQPPALVCTATVNQQASCSSCCDGSVTGMASGGTPPYTFSWSPGGCMSTTCNNLCPGTYTFTCVDANGCMCSYVITVSFTTSVNTTTAISGLDVFPNPAGRSITVKANINTSSGVHLYLVNMLGEVVFEKTENAVGVMTENIDVSALPQGAYFVQLKSDKGSSFIKVIKQ